MRVKIAERDEISCADDAIRKTKEGLDHHLAESPGLTVMPVVIPRVEASLEEDDWYATMPDDLFVPM